MTIGSAIATIFCATSAHATNVTEFPDNGSEQMGRGGAWVARASDPLAAFYNPAGLAGQDTNLTLQANITFAHTCFTRVGAGNDMSLSSDPLYNSATNAFPRICNNIAPFPNPQLAFAYRLNDRVGLGFAVLGPSGNGNSAWPQFLNDANGPEAAPQRYLLLKSSAVVVTPTMAVGVEVAPGLRFGASFQWGIATIKLANASTALNAMGSQASPRQNDVFGEIQAKDVFFPGFTLGSLWSAAPNLDVGAWYKWSAPINAKGDLFTEYPYFTPAVAGGNINQVTLTDTSKADCGVGAPNNPCGSGNNAKIRIVVPMEAKLGFRYHKPRSPHEDPHHRDPITQDLWDAEVDFTWANNSAFNNLQIRFPGDSNDNGTIPVGGTPGTVPPNTDVKTGFKDVFGIRAGGDVNVLPGRIALRGGAFYETKGEDQTYQNIDFAGSWRMGLALGGTYRLPMGANDAAPHTRALEFMLGYGKIFYGVQDNTSATGIDGLSGVACNPAAMATGTTCPNGNQKFRSNWPVNLGKITNSTNVINVGASYRF